MTNPPHASHPAIVARLKHAEGHLRSVIGMIEDGRPWQEIAQRLQAVEKAVANAKRRLIHVHLDYRLNAERAPSGRDAPRAIARYL